MKVFISYHRADSHYEEIVEGILKENSINYYAVPKNASFDGLNHNHIKDIINTKMHDCDVLLCIVGEETYSRPHVDWELHEALKGNVGVRTGLLAVMLETRGDNKNDINYDTFPNRIQDNEDYAVYEQFASLHSRIVPALEQAIVNRKDRKLQVNNTRSLMILRSGSYYDNN